MSVGGMRRYVAEATRAAHERLHQHPQIGALVAPGLTLATYQDVLRAFSVVLHGAERRRKDVAVWPGLSLAPACAALRVDCGGAPSPTVPAELAGMHSRAEILGMLYALHGAQFGGTVIDRHVGASLPDAPRAYFSRGTDPMQWRKLLEAMEAQTRPAQIVEGALCAFAALDREARQTTVADGVDGPMPPLPLPETPRPHRPDAAAPRRGPA